MLLNPALTGGTEAARLADLATYVDPSAYQVYEKTTRVDGTDCLLFANDVAHAYLDVERNFALVKLDVFELEWSEPEGRELPAIIGRKATTSVSLSDFENFGNGLWLPRQISTESFQHFGSGGQLAWQEEPEVEEIRVSKMQVNPVLDPSVFSDIIPDNVMVADGIRGTAYVQGDRLSIGSEIEKNVDQKSRNMFLWVNSFVLVLFVGFYLYKNRIAKSSKGG